MGQEDLEQIYRDVSTSDIFGLDTPSVGPVIDVEIVFLERRGELIAGTRLRFSGSDHGDRVLSVAEPAREVAHERIDPDTFDGLCMAVQHVELTAALGVAEVMPVGRLIAV